MKTTVDGVSITLTKEQVDYIKKVKANRLKSLKTFEDVLLKFGFKKFNSKSGVFYDNDDKGWYAEIYDDDCVWMTGNGLKKISSFPGGWMYGTPDALIEELAKHIAS